ncbi:MAG: hypothetical protein WC516_09965 [Patescibacteria group bacterium]|jgi:hypothetical protein|nr:hypothetical protein [Sideroxydans sp.]
MEFWKAVKTLQEGKTVKHISFAKWITLKGYNFLVSLDENMENPAPMEVPLSWFIEKSPKDWIIKEDL